MAMDVAFGTGMLIGRMRVRYVSHDEGEGTRSENVYDDIQRSYSLLTLGTLSTKQDSRRRAETWISVACSLALSFSMLSSLIRARQDGLSSRTTYRITDKGRIPARRGSPVRPFFGCLQNTQLSFFRPVRPSS